jgi:hypothetical protein
MCPPTGIYLILCNTGSGMCSCSGYPNCRCNAPFLISACCIHLLLGGILLISLLQQTPYHSNSSNHNCSANCHLTHIHHSFHHRLRHIWSWRISPYPASLCHFNHGLKLGFGNFAPFGTYGFWNFFGFGTAGFGNARIAMLAKPPSSQYCRMRYSELHAVNLLCFSHHSFLPGWRYPYNSFRYEFLHVEYQLLYFITYTKSI